MMIDGTPGALLRMAQKSHRSDNALFERHVRTDATKSSRWSIWLGGLHRRGWQAGRRGFALGKHHALDLVAVQVLNAAADANLDVHSRNRDQIAVQYAAVTKFDGIEGRG